MINKALIDSRAEETPFSCLRKEAHLLGYKMPQPEESS